MCQPKPSSLGAGILRFLKFCEEKDIHRIQQNLDPIWHRNFTPTKQGGVDDMVEVTNHSTHPDQADNNDADVCAAFDKLYKGAGRDGRSYGKAHKCSLRKP